MGKITRLLQAHTWLSYVMIVLLAAVDALVSIAFIYPNDFAPVGIMGFTTMIQYLFGVSVGYIYSLLNAPMLIIAFFVLSRSYSLKNLTYILSFSALTVVFQTLIAHFDWQIEFVATTSEQAILAAALYGAFFGILYPVMIWLGGATGGTDILAGLIHHFNPRFNLVWVLFSINAGVALMSYFVYDRELLPVVLSVTCALLSGLISDYMFKGVSSALKFEIITDCPVELSREIMETTEHGCTMVPATGMYSGESRAMLVCIINKRQRVEMEQIIAKYKGSFGFCSPVKSTYGFFDRFQQ